MSSTTQSEPTPTATEQATAPGANAQAAATTAFLRVYHIVLFAVIGGTALPVWLHWRTHAAINVHQIGMAFFLWINAIIALWEICLFLRIDHIERQHAIFVPKYKGRELDCAVDFFKKSVPLGKILSPTVWADLWASYSVFDESYANRKSFGFFVDVGNGFTTFLPALLVIVGMTFEVIPARALGIVALILNYQMWYGTLVYFGSFLFNKRYRGHTPFNLALFVGFTNGIWFTFPVWGMVLAVQMIYSNSYVMFR